MDDGYSFNVSTKYDYAIYVGEIDNLINNMNKSINYNNETTDAYFNRTVGYYNRFKMPSLNEAFTKDSLIFL